MHLQWQPSGEKKKLDLLSNLMGAIDEETGEAMTDRMLRDQVLSLLVAGHEVIAYCT